MSPDAESYLILATRNLDEAAKIQEIGLARVAARSAYSRPSMPAEAIVFERTGRAAKTRSGLRASFAELLNAQEDGWMRKFLGTAYRYKEIADYSIDQRDLITAADAERAIVEARRFLEAIAARLS